MDINKEVPFTIAGKCEPDSDAFKALSDEGFDSFELYLNTTILQDMSVEEIVSTCQNSPGEVVAVHTPHIKINDPQNKHYFEKTDEIAAALDAALVMDSNPTSMRYMPNLYPEKRIDAPEFGYENDPSVSSFYMETVHLGQNKNMVLDTAHLHMSEKTYLPFIESLLANYQHLIPVVHLAEGTRLTDGLAYGEGTVELAQVFKYLLRYNYSGVVTLETSQPTQPDALEFCREILQD